jgi:hypothetical protein
MDTTAKTSDPAEEVKVASSAPEIPLMYSRRWDSERFVPDPPFENPVPKLTVVVRSTSLQKAMSVSPADPIAVLVLIASVPVPGED